MPILMPKLYGKYQKNKGNVKHSQKFSHIDLISGPDTQVIHARGIVGEVQFLPELRGLR